MSLVTGKCGHQMHDSDTFCPVCGERQPGSYTRRVLIATGGTLLLAGAFGAGLLLRGEESDPDTDTANLGIVQSTVTAEDRDTGNSDATNSSGVTGAAVPTKTREAAPTSVPEVTVTPRPTSTPAPPTPTPTPLPAPGTVLFDAAVDGWDGWAKAGGWQAFDGMLVNDGSNENERTWITAPIDLGTVVNYAVEAEMQWIVQQHEVNKFGLFARVGQDGGYWTQFYTNSVVWEQEICAGPQPGCWDAISSASFDPGADWHAYRLEVQGNTVRLLIDGVPILEVTDNQYLAPGKVGLWSYEAQLTVRGFKVIAL